ncbi:hypothetical protein [Corynebacterium yudongzhengii]|nr:hypothetical protein [Corynebacterium yudongzhengii]
MAVEFEGIKGLASPARKALREAGYPHLEALDGANYQDILALRGIGPRALERLQQALLARGWTLIECPVVER